MVNAKSLYRSEGTLQTGVLKALSIPHSQPSEVNIGILKSVY